MFLWFSFGFGGGNDASSDTSTDAVHGTAVAEGASGADGSKSMGDTTTATEVTSTTAVVAPTIHLQFLSFVKEGTDHDARKWWEDNRIRLTDLYRKNHRDVLRGRRAKQRANTSSWK